MYKLFTAKDVSNVVNFDEWDSRMNKPTPSSDKSPAEKTVVNLQEWDDSLKTIRVVCDDSPAIQSPRLESTIRIFLFLMSICHASLRMDKTTEGR